MLNAWIRRVGAPARLILLTAIAFTPIATSVTADGQISTDPRVTAALAAQKRLGAAMGAQDIPGIEALMAPDLLVNAPVNKVVNRDNVIGRIKAGQISYEPDGTRNIEFAGVRGDVVVIMGEEILHPNKNSPYAGKTEYRRFTDIWQQTDGVWKLWIRQATITRSNDPVQQVTGSKTAS